MYNSEVEELYYKLQQKLGSARWRKWEELHPQEQQTFVDAINYIIHVCH